MQMQTSTFNPRTAGGLRHLRTAGGRIHAPPPENSKTKKDSEKRLTTLDRPRQVLQKNTYLSF